MQTLSNFQILNEDRFHLRNNKHVAKCHSVDEPFTLFRTIHMALFIQFDTARRTGYETSRREESPSKKRCRTQKYDEQCDEARRGV